VVQLLLFHNMMLAYELILLQGLDLIVFISSNATDSIVCSLSSEQCDVWFIDLSHMANGKIHRMHVLASMPPFFFNHTNLPSYLSICLPTCLSMDFNDVC
jgi:hypothetical protein